MYISGIHLKVIIRSYLILKDLLKKDTMGKFRSEMLMMRMIERIETDREIPPKSNRGLMADVLPFS